ncbi:g6075 [Coccomyxa viridis]|uniref:G6075 protein n=1 Tax=Coccomyxa viridis TaxID=1274662 RepID=A0ABP1FZC4_9CHLO
MLYEARWQAFGASRRQLERLNTLACRRHSIVALDRRGKVVQKSGIGCGATLMTATIYGMSVFQSTASLAGTNQVVLCTHGGCESAWGSSLARASTACHGEIGHALHAMMRCNATELTQISWRARDTSSTQAAPAVTDCATDTAAELTNWANTMAAPLLVSCARSIPGHNPREMGCGRQANWVIGGGLGALGGLMAAWLADGGCGRLTLLSRSGHLRSQDNAMRHLLFSHTTVTMERVDIGAAQEAAACLEAAGSEGQLGGILHASGILHDALIGQQTPALVREVYAPKVAGGKALMKAAGCHPLSQALLFSSIAALTGPAGSANYAAANAALDAAAAQYSNHGLPVQSIQWGAWSSLGMVATSAAVLARMQRGGITAIVPLMGLHALHSILGIGSSTVAAVPFCWEVFSVTPQGRSPFYSNFAGTSAPVHKVSDPNTAAKSRSELYASTPQAGMAIDAIEPVVLEVLSSVLGSQPGLDVPLVQAGLDSLGAVEVRNELSQKLRLELPSTAVFDYPTVSALCNFIGTVTARTSGKGGAVKVDSTVSREGVLSGIHAIVRSIAGADVAPDAPLSQAGLDSLASVELRNDLGRTFDIELPSTVAFDYPTINALADQIMELTLAAQQHSSTHITPSPNNTTAYLSRDTQHVIAIDSCAGRFSQPAAGGHAIDSARVTPLERWDVDSAAPAVSRKPGSRFGRFMNGVEDFDAACFGIHASEALVMDPQQRLMLEDSWQVLQHWHPEAAKEPETAVIAALSFWDYSLVASVQGSDTYKATGRCFSVAAGRISYSYGLKGPAISIDTACSSSLSGTSMIASMLQRGVCGRAVLTAVLCTLDPATIGMLAAANMLAPDGRCKTLDSAADGHNADSAAPLNVVLGSAINQDGRSSSLTAPNGPSQQQVMRLAVEAACLHGSEVVCLEMHGTGTPLGDPIEIGAAAAVFGKLAWSAPGEDEKPSHALCLGAVKSTLGHTEPAAGATAICRTLFRHVQAATADILHLTKVNPYVASTLGGTFSAHLPRQMSGSPQLRGDAYTGISGFAFQGTNAHVILGRKAQSAGSATLLAKAQWQRKRHWFSPQPHLLLIQAITGAAEGGSMVFDVGLHQPSASYLLEHQVMGRPILPGTAMLDSCLSAPSTLLTGDSLKPGLALENSAISAPLILPRVPSTGHLCLRQGHWTKHLAASLRRGADIAAASRDPAALDASTHFGALFDVDQGQMPRVPIRLDHMSKPSNFKGAGCWAYADSGLHRQQPQSGVRVSSFAMQGAAGTLLAKLGSLTSQPLRAQRLKLAASVSALEATYAFLTAIEGLPGQSDLLEASAAVAGFLRTAVLEDPKILGCWQQPALQRQEARPVFCQPGAYIISGGLGSLGLLVTKWLSQSQSGQTNAAVLLGRTGRGPTSEEAAATAAQAAAWLCIVRCDAGVQEEAAAACACSQGLHKPWNGYMHAGGVLADALVPKQSAASLRTVFSPKVNALSNIQAGLHLLPLQTAHVFASISADVGNAGQSNYAAANAAVSTMMLSSAQKVSLQASARALWVVQLVGAHGQVPAWLQQTQISVAAFYAKVLIVALQASAELSSPWPATTAAAAILWDNLLKAPGRRHAMYDDFRVEVIHPVEALPGHPKFPQGYARADGGDFQSKSVLADILNIIERALGGRIGADQPLMEAGLDSLGAVELRNAIGSKFDIDLPATAVFDYPTASALADHIKARMVPSQKALREDPMCHPVGVTRTGQSVAAKLMAILLEVVGATVSETEPLMEAGLDSLGAVELRNAISAAFAVDVPATVAFDYPTVAALASHISSKVAPQQARVALATTAVDVDLGRAFRASISAGLQVTGIGCIYPGPKQGVEGFWEAMQCGQTLQRCVPLERWDMDSLYDPEGSAGSSYTRFGAFAADVDLHDAAFFRLSRTEAVAVDPQTRLLLQVSAEAVQQSGGAVRSTGTYIGCMFLDYMSLQREGYGMSSTGAVMTGSGLPYQSGRVAYAFNLQGPCNGIDTACSSSLVAAHNARQGILSGECEAALAGGINVMLWHDITSGICQLQALSPVGRCKSFEASADGYGRGEGFNAVVMQAPDLSGRLVAQGRALIQGSAVNQDGRSSSLTAPNGPAQQALVGAAIRSGDQRAVDVSYVAVHGTGTPLGDPIEIGALSAALACQGPFVPRAVADWAKRASHAPMLPRQLGALCEALLAGTSSFGMSGVNAHMLVSAPPQLPSVQNMHLLHWQDQRFWPGPALRRLAHPAPGDSTSGTSRFVSRLDKAAVAFLQDHSVKGRIILPATAMLEAAAEASSMLHDAVDVSADSALKHTSFLRALALQR